jgi:CHAT domain-containing protein/Tfp pilus assembly protein PilF
MKLHLWCCLLSSTLLLPLTAPAAVVVFPERAVAREEQAAIPRQTFEGRLDQTSQVLSSDGSYYNVHTFEGRAGQAVRIDMESSEFDTFLWLLAPDGSVLAQNDDFSGTNSRIILKLPTAGIYMLWANSYSTGETGAYTLTIQPSSVEEVEATARFIEADRLLQQGSQQYNVSQFRDALQSWQQALDLYRDPVIQAAFPHESRRGEGNALGNLGIVYRNLGQYERAINFYEQRLVIAREIGDRRGEGDTLGNLGVAYWSLGQYERAIDFYEQSLAIAREFGNRQGEANALGNLGIAYLDLGQYERAINSYEQRLVIDREIDDRRGEGIALGNLGHAYWSLGQYERAIDFFEQSLAIAREIGDIAGEGATLNNLGGSYLELGQYARAVDFFEQSLAIARETGDRRREGGALGNLGNAYSNLGQYERAIEFYEQHMAVAREIGDRQGERIALNNLGTAYWKLGDYHQAIDFFEQSLAIARETGDRRGEGGVLGNLGNTYADLGRYQQATQVYQQALAIAQAIGDRSREGLWLSNIGSLMTEQGQPELAIVFYKQSVNVREAIRGDLRGLPQDDQQSFTETVADSYRSLANLLLEAGRVLEAQEVLDLLRLQELEDFQLRSIEGTSETQQGLSFWQAEREILERYDQFLTQPDADINNFIAQPEIGDRINQLQRDARGQNLNPEQLVRLQRNLQQAGNAALLYPLILDDRLELVLVTTTRLTRHTVAVDRATLEAAIANFRHAITDRRSDPIPQAQELYQWLMAPLVDDLDAAAAETILYAADGQLRYIPLAALHDGDQWLTQRYTINHITAASLMDFSRSEPIDLSILAGAFPASAMEITLGGESVWFGGLPFAQDEVRNLTQLPGSKTTAFFSEAFNRRALEPRLGDYRIVHLATHAEFRSGHPMDSFILLGDGDRITLFDLDQWELPNVDLVVLSACRTGISSGVTGESLGTGEEILGFGYQIQRTGARGAIASLWYVSDGGTQVLMDAFYAGLQSGLSSSAAVRQAQIALITGDLTASGVERGASIDVISTRTGLPASVANRLSHPYYWAPFILIGNGL